VATIAIVGLGYVGLVYGGAFADLGNSVRGVDIDAEKVAKLREGIVPIYEPGLNELIRRNLEAGRLHFTTDYAEAIPDSEFVFICVGTPSTVDGDADMRAVRAAAEAIGRHLRGHHKQQHRGSRAKGLGLFVLDANEAGETA